MSGVCLHLLTEHPVGLEAPSQGDLDPDNYKHSAFFVDVSIKHPASLDLSHTWPETDPSPCTLNREHAFSQGSSGQHLWGPRTVLSLHLVPNCVTLGGLPSFSELQVSYLHDGDNNAKLKRLLQGLNVCQVLSSV